MKTSGMMKMGTVVVAIMLAGSVSMADSRGGHYDRGGYYDRGGRYDRGCHYGYYHNSRGEWVFGLLGLGLIAAVEANRPVYVQQPVVYQTPPQVVYVQQPPQVVYQAAPVVQPPPVVIEQTVRVETCQPATTTINIQNSNGSFTPVTLHQEGANWVGPKGEYYRGIPTVGQLRPLYGM